MVKEIPTAYYTAGAPPPPPQQYMPAAAAYQQDRRDRQVGQKIKATFWCAVLFVVLSYNGTYRAVNTIVSTFMNKDFGGVSDDGCPTVKGVFVHSVLFFAIAFLLI